MQVIALGWIVWSLTHDPLMLGLSGLAAFLPALLFALPAGHLADRYDRRAVVLVAGIALAAGAVAMFGWALAGFASVPLLFAAIAGFASMHALADPAYAAMGIFLAHRPVDRHAGRVLLGTVAAFGLFTIGFGLSASLWLSLLCLTGLGAAGMISMAIRSVLIAADTPDAMRGRVLAVESVFIGASNELGEFESGVLAALVGAAPAVVLGGIGTVLVAALFWRAFPALRDRDRLVETLRG